MNDIKRVKARLEARARKLQQFIKKKTRRAKWLSDTLLLSKRELVDKMTLPYRIANASQYLDDIEKVLKILKRAADEDNWEIARPTKMLKYEVEANHVTTEFQSRYILIKKYTSYTNPSTWAICFLKRIGDL